MAQGDIFLKIDGVDGEAQDDKHKNEIDIHTFHIGAANMGAGHAGGGSGSGKAHIHDMQLTKQADKSSPNLFIACCNGKHHKTATLVVRKAGEKPHEYLKYTMHNVLMSSYSAKHDGSGSIVKESFSLNFSKIEMAYIPQNADGTAGAQIVKTHDVAANKSS
jgi:type VI secretion system secreted protein Hcp